MNNDLLLEEVKTLDLHPLTNKDVISLVKQEDGNWRGFTVKAGKLVQERQGDPGTVLQMLITHE